MTQFGRSKAGKRGGITTKNRYGPAFFSKIGKKGGLARRKRRFPDRG